MNLAELQRYFAQAATSGNGPLPDLERVFRSTAQLPARARLAIYNRGYFARLLAALASVFAETKRVLGAPAFERLGLSYIAHHPSEHPAVERVGRSFSEYLRGADAPMLVVDLARLEWARLCALVSTNPPGLATIAAVEPKRFPEARLRFVPSLHRLQLDPRALSAFAGGDFTASDLQDQDRAQSSCGVAIWRPEHAVRHQSLEALEWQALARAVSGHTLSDVCAVFDSGSQSEDVRRAFQVISGWFVRKWLANVVYDEPRPPAE